MTMTLGQSKQKRVLKFLFENWFKTENKNPSKLFVIYPDGSGKLRVI